MKTIQISTTQNINSNLLSKLNYEHIWNTTNQEISIYINITSYLNYPNTYILGINNKNNTYISYINRDKAKNIINNLK